MRRLIRVINGELLGGSLQSVDNLGLLKLRLSFADKLNQLLSFGFFRALGNIEAQALVTFEKLDCVETVHGVNLVVCLVCPYYVLNLGVTSRGI